MRSRTLNATRLLAVLATALSIVLPASVLARQDVEHVTRIVKDIDGRVVSRRITGAGGTTPPIVTEELFGYNADGRLAYHSRKQTGLGDDVVTTTRYDSLGRVTGTSTFGGRVLLDPSTPGGDAFTTLETKTVHNLAWREIIDYDAHRTGQDSVAPRTTKKLDRLGRTQETRRTGTAVGSGSIKSIALYDIHGELAYTSDQKRTAAITQHDHFGRPIASMLADGTRAHVVFNEWDEVVETIGFQKRAAVTDPLVETSRSLNVYTEQGRLQLSLDKIESAGRARATAFTWEAGDTITTNRVGEASFITGLDGSTKMRVAQTTRDSAGRVVSEIVGEATGPADLVAAANTFSETRVTEYFGDLARKSEVLEPRAARKVAIDTGYDGLGRPIESREAGGAYATRMSYDEAGNMLSLQTPGLPFAFMSYDARGLLWRQQLPSGDIVRRAYDERGTLRQYIDEEGRVTFYDTDGLGRVFRIRYPDGTSEESRFEDETGVLLASRDRAGQWIWFEYDDQHNGRLIAEHLGGTGAGPTLTPDPFTAYDYDDAGRVKRIRNAEAGVEFEGFDLLGRPHVTRTIRYKKTGCIPSLTPCGSGLSATPQIAEIYTQGHQWNVFDERDRWRMPVVGSTLPADAAEADTPWRNWIEEQRDGGANVVRQGESVSRTAAAVSFLEASTRGMGRLAERKRTASTPATELLTRYGYADAAGSGASAVVPVSPVTPGPPSGALGRHEVLSGTARIAGTEVTLGVNQRIERIEDLGLVARESKFDYDDRGRLGNTILLRRDGDSANQPVANSIVQPAGFVEARSIAPPRLSPTEFGLLGVMATSVVPVTWTADAPTAGGQITHRSFTNGPAAAGDQSFTWTGGRRTGSGSWNVTYDARGRLTSAEGTDRRIEYDYDPMDRLVGRIALQKDAANAWTIETRTDVLARDGLPASSTFVWDPIVDRLIAVYDSAVVTSATTATIETGLVRQYIHGDQGYDDPVEVLIAWTAGAIPSRYLPIIDEAGSGSLQAVADGDGNLVERVVYADAYGDAPRYLQGAVVEHIRNDITDGTRTLTVKFSEAIDVSTLADGLRLAARDSAGNVLRTLAVAPTFDASERIATWSIDETTWTTFSDAAASIQFSVTPTLRFRGWGATPLQPAAPWETILGRANASAAFPFYKNLTLPDLASDGVLYDLPDLYLAARAESRTQLLFDFHALPLRDPATSFTYVRARWYDASTGSFLTPDPMGYEDASNLYAYAGNDPLNAMDPSGELSASDVGKGAWGLTKGVGKGAWGLFTGVIEGVVGVGQASYYSTGALMYHVTGQEMYREQSETFHQAWSAIKHAVTNPDIIITAGANKINEVRDTIASGDAEAIGDLVGRGAFELATMFIPAAAGSKLSKGARVVRAMETVGDGADGARALRSVAKFDDLGNMSATTRRASPFMKHGDDVASATRLGPCPLRQVPACVAAGTLIATPDDGATPIEDLRVGDRVATTNINPTLPDGTTTVDPINWHLLKLRMTNPTDSGDLYEIETLRPLDWVLQHDAFPGRTIEFETERSPVDLAYVVSVEKAPPITFGSGRLVLSTFTHRDQILTIHFEGGAVPLDTTPTHRLYSVERADWVLTSSLSAGDRVRTSIGQSTISSLERRQVARVFDIEVETDHAYFVAGSDVLSHNCGITRLSKSRVVFENVEVRAVRDLSHMRASTLKAMMDPAIGGFAAVTRKRQPIQLHHLGQEAHGLIVEIPRKFHKTSNKRQHSKGTSKGVGLTTQERATFDAWRTRYWKARAEEELMRRGLL